MSNPGPARWPTQRATRAACRRYSSSIPPRSAVDAARSFLWPGADTMSTCSSIEPRRTLHLAEHAEADTGAGQELDSRKVALFERALYHGPLIPLPVEAFDAEPG